MKQGNHLRLIDVREPHELEISHIQGAELIPLGQLASRLSELDSAQDMVVFCKTGARSTRGSGAAGQRRIPQSQEFERRDQRLGQGSRSEPTYLLDLS